MDFFDNYFEQYFTQDFMHSLQNFVFALIFLLIGWIVAKIVGNLVENGVRKSKLDEKLFKTFETDQQDDDEKKVDYSKITGKVIYYLLLIAAFVMFFNKINLTMLSNPLSEIVATVIDFIPAILQAAIILLFAWIIASVIKWLIIRGTEKTKLQTLLAKVKLAETEEQVKQFVETLGKVVFYLTLLLFIPGILEALNIAGVAQPFSGLLASVLSFIPKLLAAGLIFAIGWFVAKIIKGIAVNLLDALGSEKLIERLRLQKLFEGTSFATFIGHVVFVIILIPVTIASLEQLHLTGITDPAVTVLADIMTMIPNILIAIGLVFVGIWLGKIVGEFVHSYLKQLGFDRLTSKMNVNIDVVDNKLTPSAVVGYVVHILIAFFLSVQALYLVKFDFLVGIATSITAYLPHVLAAILILGIALIVANVVEKMLVNLLVGPATNLLAGFAKYAIIVLASLMALSQLGIATTIVSSAFILILGGVALAFGLAFGLGGREFASKYLQKFDHTIDETKVKNNQSDE